MEGLTVQFTWRRRDKPTAAIRCMRMETVSSASASAGCSHAGGAALAVGAIGVEMAGQGGGSSLSRRPPPPQQEQPSTPPSAPPMSASPPHPGATDRGRDADACFEALNVALSIVVVVTILALGAAFA